ncbi:MAG: NAD-dependent epimerase/dehydratase family protein [Bacteroidota bacterium]
MQVLVTGATGLIGSHVVKALVAQKHKVKALVRPESNSSHLPLDKIELCKGDLFSPESLITAAKGCQVIYHTAGVFSYWGYSGEQFIREAKQGIENIIRAAAHQKIKRIVFTSSSVTIGATEKQEILSEGHPGNFDEAPAYVIAKKEQEETAFAIGKKTGVEVIAICPALTIGGPDHHLTESNRMIVNYLKDPYKATWIGGCNLVNVRDVADAMLLLAERGKAGERYIAGSDNMSWQEVHQLISSLCGLPGPYITALRTSSYLLSAVQELWSHFTKERPASTIEQAKMVGKYYWYSSEKLKRLGYNPGSSEEALVETLSWLVTSNHIPGSLRSAMKLSDAIYSFRNQQQPV